MSSSAEPTRAAPMHAGLILPASLAAAAVAAVIALLWAEHGEAVFVEMLTAGFVGCLG